MEDLGPVSSYGVTDIFLEGNLVWGDQQDVKGIRKLVSGGCLPQCDKPGRRDLHSEVVDGHIVEGVGGTKVGNYM